MDNNASLSVFSRVLPEALLQRSKAVSDAGVMLNVIRHDEPDRRFVGLKFEATNRHPAVYDKHVSEHIARLIGAEPNS